jgi:integrase
MARKVRHSALESRSARLKLKIRRKPYPGPSLGRGVALHYRRNQTNGTWVLKASDGSGSYWTKRLADSDDFADSDGKEVLNFFEAQDRAKLLARGDTTSEAAPITIDGALQDYKRDLEARNAAIRNAIAPRKHLSSALLAKPLQLVTSKELKAWRDSLLGEIKPATINRLCKCVCAAFELAAQHDQRINRTAWEIGLARLPDAEEARNVVLSDAKVLALVAEATARDAATGLLFDVLATTGARPSQAIRLRCDDLQDHPSKPKLTMPKSGKGGGRNRVQKKVERYSVPITSALAKKLKLAAKGRDADALLLVQWDGTPWPNNPAPRYRVVLHDAVAAIGLDPTEVSVYALRHSSITRMLLKGVPVRLVASLHDTSIAMIEKNYSRHITEYAADDHARAALLQPDDRPSAPTANVVPLVR